MKVSAVIIPHPARIVRGIIVRPVLGEPGKWQGVFPGDPWTGPFLTPPGAKEAILNVFEAPDVRRGLPMIESTEPAELCGTWTPEGKAAWI